MLWTGSVMVEWNNTLSPVWGHFRPKNAWAVRDIRDLCPL